MNPTATPIDHFLDEQKALACIHCGLCLGSCPTYLETGNENDSPRGRIYLMRAVQDGRLPLGDTAVRHIDLCLGCRACEAACPSGVQYGELLEHTRDHIEKHHRRPWFQTFLRRVAIEQVFPFPERLKLALLPARLLKKLGAEKLLPKFAQDALALVPDKMSAVQLPAFSPADAKGRNGCPQPSAESQRPSTASPRRAEDCASCPRVGFISGCVMSVMFGETNANSVKLLNRAGCDVHTPGEQGCCGALYAHSGRLDDARACARHNIAVFERFDVEAIIINAAGCGSTLKEYGALLRDDPRWAERAVKFSSKVKDLTEWLATGQKSEVSSQESGSGKVTYHDACHLAHPQRITKQPRDLVKEVAGADYVELSESDVCCGSAGSYNLTEPEMAERLQRRKTEHILKTGAKVVVTTNPGCLLQIRAGLKKAGRDDIEALHIADYLARATE